MITKNHKTTTVLVALAALSAVLVAGSVAAASDHAAFAHKKGANKSFENSGIAVPTITAQKQKCETTGGGATDSLGYVTVTGSEITGSCTASSTNSVTQSGGAVAAASDHAAFAHKKGVKNSGIAIPVITAQLQSCKTAGGSSPVDTSCTATSDNTVDESGGVMGGP